MIGLVWPYKRRRQRRMQGSGPMRCTRGMAAVFCITSNGPNNESITAAPAESVCDGSVTMRD